MALLENLAYSGVQLAHNFGAVAVVGSAAAATWLVSDQSSQQRLAKLMALGWAVQALTGAGFGATSYYFYGKFPDIKGIAIAALVVKIMSTITGFFLVLNTLAKSSVWDEAARH
ncbi:MAG: hypothetical protein ABIN45_03255, partial [Gammaproteobacteria bacterium]